MDFWNETMESSCADYLNNVKFNQSQATKVSQLCLYNDKSHFVAGNANYYSIISVSKTIIVNLTDIQHVCTTFRLLIATDYKTNFVVGGCSCDRFSKHRNDNFNIFK